MSPPGLATPAGEALLAFSAQLPWVAPAAYLIGAIVNAQRLI